MFPFEFYDELTNGLTSHTINNPAFIHKFIDSNISTEKRKEQYQEHLEDVNSLMQTVATMNIVNIEPFGEVLLLNSISDKDQILKSVNDKTGRSQISLLFLIVQLYDSSDLPVFSNDVSDDTISKIPEVLIDDPNLLIGIVELGDTQTTAQVLKIPDRIKDKMLVDIDDDSNE